MSEGNRSDDAARVLIVDDDLRNQKLLGRMLSNAGYRIETCDDGRSGLASIEREAPDLVLLDCMMPDLDGFEVCRRIKAREESAGLPVLLVTALGDADEVRGLDAGADDYVTKPVDRESLLARVRTHLRIKGLRDEVVEGRELLRRQNDRLVELERIRFDLVHMLVHDLKSPLNALEISVEMLKDARDGGHTDLAETALGNIGSCGSRLRFIIQNILDVARLEQAQMQLEPVTMGLRDALDEVIRSSHVVAYSQQVELEVEVPEELQVEADAPLVGRILENLLSNAIRVTEPGRDVFVHAEETDAAVCVTVGDRGPGVAEAEREAIFEKFCVGRRTPANTGGHGLGLSFCRLAVGAHGGRIWVDRRDGGGSLFRFELPRAAALQPA